MAEGLIVKALSGFYYVEEEWTEKIYECRSRGVFRVNDISPLVGDRVIFQIEANDKGYVTEVKERKNSLIRPAIANIDQVLLVFSVVNPDFNQPLLDRFLAIIEASGLTPVLILTKWDLLEDEEKMAPYINYYEAIGYQVFKTSKRIPETLAPLKELFKDRISVFAGQSGVGKSSILNALDLKLQLNEGEVSKALGRGRHTTRHVELYKVYGGLIADTPGFSSLDFDDFDIDAILLSQSFVEYFKLSEDCKFRGCTHQNEPKCAVKEKLGESEVFDARYLNYVNFQKEIAGIRPTYQKKTK